MVGSRTVTAVLGLLLSLALSVLVWWYFDSLLLFIVVPFVPFLFHNRGESPPVTTCPTCGFRTQDPSVNFCPRDGTELEESEGV